jgi:outer membrane lipoprotein-sorting protein
MWLRSLTIILLLLTFFAEASNKNQLFLERAQKYFNGFQTLQAKFIQDSTTQKEKGYIFIQKPGKFRFSYENTLDIISTGDTVIYVDKELEKTYYLKLEDTMLYLLSNDIDFKDKSLTIENISLTKDFGSITISSNKIDDKNLVSFKFKLIPFTLAAISIGQENQIIHLNLSNLSLNKELDQRLFTYRKK